MRGGRATVACVALISVMASDRSALSQPAGGAKPDQAVRRVEEMLGAGKLGPALAGARAAVQAAPEHAGAHIVLGDALLAVYMFQDAAAEYERARALGADTPSVASAYGAALLASGDAARAEKVASDARARWPQDDNLLVLGRTLEEIQHLRGRARPALAAGTAPAFVAQVAAKLDRGAILEVLRDDVADTVFRDVMKGRAVDDEFLRGAARGLRSSLPGSSRRFTAYEVEPQTRERGGRTVVPVRLLVEGTFSPQLIALLEKAAGDPRAEGVVDAELLAIVRALEPGDRAHLLDALKTQVMPGLQTVEVELVGGPGLWKIADARLEGGSRTLSASMAEMARLTQEGVIDGPADTNLAYKLGRLTGSLLLLALISFFAVRFWLRRRR